MSVSHVNISSHNTEDSKYPNSHEQPYISQSELLRPAQKMSRPQEAYHLKLGIFIMMYFIFNLYKSSILLFFCDQVTGKDAPTKS